jgi:hypothetical protein
MQRVHFALCCIGPGALQSGFQSLVIRRLVAIPLLSDFCRLANVINNRAEFRINGSMRAFEPLAHLV